MATQVALTLAERYRALLRTVLAPRAFPLGRARAGRGGRQAAARPVHEQTPGPLPADLAGQPLDPYLVGRLAGLSHETLVCLFYDGEGAFRGEQSCEGAPSSVAADRCALTRAAVAHEARYVLIAHNHPAGEARPSEQDIEATRALHRLFAALGIRLLDHAIVARDGSAFSFRQAGLI